MKFSLFLVSISSLSSIGAAQILGLPIFNPLDPRFNNWQPAGPNDSRGPCPGLNSLANHAFLPRSGKNITIIDIIRGAFQGFHLTPEISIFAGGGELIRSRRLTAFDLHELSDHGFIEHDCSMSRADIEVGNNNDFNETIWSVPLNILKGFSTVTPQAMGAARTARDLFNIAHNPNHKCGARAIAGGAVESGILLQGLGGSPKLEWVRSVFELERIPTNLGFNPISILLNTGLGDLTVGLESLLSQPNLTALLGPLIIETPADLAAVVFPIDQFNLTDILNVLTLAGFPSVDLSILLGN